MPLTLYEVKGSQLGPGYTVQLEVGLLLSGYLVEEDDMCAKLASFLNANPTQTFALICRTRVHNKPGEHKGDKFWMANLRLIGGVPMIGKKDSKKCYQRRTAETLNPYGHEKSIHEYEFVESNLYEVFAINKLPVFDRYQVIGITFRPLKYL